MGLRFHTVKKGETLDALAQRFDVPPALLSALNPKGAKPGKVIAVPDGVGDDGEPDTIGQIRDALREIRELTGKLPGGARPAAIPDAQHVASREPRATKPREAITSRKQRQPIDPFAARAREMPASGDLPPEMERPRPRQRRTPRASRGFNPWRSLASMIGD